MADATIWLLLTHVLVTVNVRDPVREDGSGIMLDNLQGPLPGFVGCVMVWAHLRTEVDPQSILQAYRDVLLHSGIPLT